MSSWERDGARRRWLAVDIVRASDAGDQRHANNDGRAHRGRRRLVPISMAELFHPLADYAAKPTPNDGLWTPELDAALALAVRKHAFDFGARHPTCAILR